MAVGASQKFNLNRVQNCKPHTSSARCGKTQPHPLSATMCSRNALFVAPFCRISGPRQGRNMRFCIATRERMPRELMFRIVRVRDESGDTHVAIGRGNGRSVYVSKELELVLQTLRRSRLGRSLRCQVPASVNDDLVTLARDWDALPDDSKGLFYCEVFARNGVPVAAEQVQQCLPRGDEDLADYAIQ